MKGLIILMISILLVGCDHTDLSGEIIIKDQTWHAGDIIPLILEVPDDLKDIHDVMWAVYNLEHDHEYLEQIYFGDQMLNVITEENLKGLLEVDDIDYDRIALFIPEVSGKYSIVVEGFYKQTNPQSITDIEMIVE